MPDLPDTTHEAPRGAADRIEVLERPLHERLRYDKGDRSFHAQVLAWLTSLRDMGEAALQENHDRWNRVDEHCRMHNDHRRYAVRGDGSVKTTEKEMPFERAFVVPATFAMEQVMLAQLMSLFLARDPAIQYEGTEGGDVGPAKLLEVVAAHSMRATRLPLVLYGAFRAAIRYGICGVFNNWHQDRGWTMQPILQGPLADIVGAGYPELLRPVRKWGLRRAYNRLTSIDPYRLRTDPRYTVPGAQHSGLIGYQRTESLLFFQARRLSERQGPYFNVDALKRAGFDQQSAKRSVGREPGADHSMYSETNAYPTEHLEVTVIPAETKFNGEALGTGTHPERMWFEWCGDEVIVRAHPSSYYHGDYNILLGESIPDMHTVTNPGFGELVEPLQRFMSWSGSAHFENVRRFLNNAAIVAPSMIEMEHVLNPKAAGHVFLTQDAEELLEQGLISDPTVFYRQLQLQDVTGGFANDIRFLQDLFGRLSGVNDPVQGIQLPTTRTATEIEGMMGAASKRTQLLAEILDPMLIQPISEQMATNIQQFLEEEQWFRVGGSLTRDVVARLGESERVKVTDGGVKALIAPHDLYGQYDYIGHSTFDPPNPARLTETVSQLFSASSPFPQLFDPQASMAMGYQDYLDPRELFLWLAENLKLKDAQQRLFRPLPAPPPIDVVPDEQLESMVQAGDASPAVPN